MQGLLVTGTDTDVGKTYVSSLILKSMREAGLSVGAYKPVCSGAVPGDDGQKIWTDIESLWTATEGDFPRARICPQLFTAPLAPPRAAQIEQAIVNQELLFAGLDWWKDQVDFLLIEGAGGWCSPIAEVQTVGTFAEEIGFPVLIVSADRLGMLNHTLLTIQAIQQQNLPLAGVVINEATASSPEDNSRQYNQVDLMRMTECPVLGRIAYQTQTLCDQNQSPIAFNWSRLFDIATTNK